MTRRATPVLGTPREVRELLHEAAQNATQAATVLATLVETHDANLLTQLDRLEAEGDRITHDLLRAVRRARVAGADRGPLLNLTQALDDSVDAIERAGHAAPKCDCGERGKQLAAVVRDVARTEVKLVELLGGPADHDHQFHVDTAHHLAEEGRSAIRAALGDVVGDGIDPMVALRQKLCFDDLAAALDAGVRAVHTTDRAISEL